MRDYFISYTAVDKEWARWIAWELKRKGFSCVVQAFDFAPGDDFVQRMRMALRDSNQMIAVLSPEYLKSEYASAEVNAAIAADPLGLRRKLIPVRIRECSATEMMRGRVYIDLVGKTVEEARRLLIAGIRASRIGINTREKGVRFNEKPIYPGGPERAAGRARGMAHADEGKVKHAPCPLRILFLASEAGTGLDLRCQFKEIKAAIDRSPYRAAIRLKSVFDLTAESFLDALNTHMPHVVHFSGKQDGGDILLNSESGEVTTISDIELAGLFKSLDDQIRLVVIDTCHSWRCAKSISSVVDCAIGVKAAIYEEDATKFYAAFYRSLACGRSLRDACGQATAALQFAGTRRSEIPQLITRSGINAASLSLVSPDKPSRRKAAND